jgi:hypothetical protein
VAQDPLVLLAGVREVSALASPANPQAVTQRAFDAERERSPNHAHLPPARRITERLGLSWRDVLTVAYAPEKEQTKLLSLKDKAPSSADWLSEGHVAAVLQLAAARLDADTVSTNEYRVEREKVLAEDHARWLHGRDLLLPTAEQIVHAAGSWDEALCLAELRPSRNVGQKRKKPNAPPLPDLMERFYEAHGVQPTRPALQEWARASNIPYPSPKGRPNAFRKAREEWVERRRAAGEPDPKLPPHGKGRPMAVRPDYSANKGAPLPGERRRDRWDKESCVAAVARYVAQLPPRERAGSTSRGYRAWAAEQEHAPTMTTIRERCKSWEATRRAALKRTGSLSGPGSDEN